MTFRTMAKTFRKSSARVSKQPAARKAKRRAKTSKRAKISPALVAAHRLTPEEYQRILALVGPQPSITQIGHFPAIAHHQCPSKSPQNPLRPPPTPTPSLDH